MSNKEQHEKRKDIKWKVVTTLSIAGTATLGVLYCIQSKDIKQAKEDIELVRQVVGGPLINTLIKNEEIKRTKTDNKIRNIEANEIITDAVKTVVDELKAKRDGHNETIASYVKVRDMLKRVKRD